MDREAGMTVLLEAACLRTERLVVQDQHGMPVASNLTRVVMRGSP